MPADTSMEGRRRNFNTGQFDEELGRQPESATTGPPPTAAALDPNGWRPRPPQATPQSPEPPSYQAPGQPSYGAAQAAPTVAPPPPPPTGRVEGVPQWVIDQMGISPGTPSGTPAPGGPITEPGVPGGDAEIPGREELPSWWEEYFDLARGGSEAYLNRQQELAERGLMEDLARRGTLGGGAEAGARRELASDLEAQRAQQEFEFFDRALQFDRQWRQLDLQEREMITNQLISLIPGLAEMDRDELDALIPEILTQMGVEL